MAHGRLGSFDQALESVRAALEQTGPESDPTLLPRLNLTLGGVHIARGEWLPAEAAARRAAQAFEALGEQRYLARATNELGVVAAHNDRLRAARWHLEHALEIDAALGPAATPYGAGRDHAELAWVCLRLNDPVMAVRHGNLAIEALWDRVGSLDKADLARVSHLFGSLHRAAGDGNQAIACLNRAAAYYAQSGRLIEWQRASAELNEVLTADASPQPPSMRSSHGIPVPARDRARAHYLVTLLALGDSLASIHPWLEQRASAVTGHALALGRFLGLPLEALTALGHAGRLHDIGLTLGETADTRTQQLHPTAGAELLRFFALPGSTPAAVRHHHERWDGSGFPDGLKADAIPLVARILAVSDAYVGRALATTEADDDAAAASEHEAALAELRAGAGSAFDPDLVAATDAMHHQALERCGALPFPR